LSNNIIGYDSLPKSPFVVAFLNQKGGVGKTTLATNVATKLHLESLKVLLVDSDPQGSARDWHEAGNSELRVIGMDRPKSLEKDLKAIAQGFDWVIIDGVPQIKEMSVAAIKCADLLIIPVQPSPYDILATIDLVDIIKARQQMTDGNPKAYFCVNRKIANTSLGKEVFPALRELGLPVMESSTTQRVAYSENVSQGKTVFDTGNTQAIEEITNIVNEMKKILI
jgi:chromosome partitioning protein